MCSGQCRVRQCVAPARGKRGKCQCRRRLRGQAPFANVNWDAPIPFLQLLLDSGAGLNSVDYDYEETQLGKRARSGDEETVRWLLGKGAYVNHISIYHQEPHLLVLLKTGPRVWWAYFLTTVPKRIPMSRLIVRHSLKPASTGRVELGKILVEHGALVNSGGDVQAGCEGDTALHIAARLWTQELCRVSHRKRSRCKCKGEEEGNTPLMSAIAGRANSDTPDDGSFLGIVNSLLHAHANIDEQDKYGLTALHMATANGDVVVIHHLLEYHAATSIRSSLRFGSKYVRSWDSLGHFSFLLSSGEARVTLYDPLSDRSF